MSPVKVLSLIWKYKTVIGIAISLGLFSYYVWLADKRGQERDDLEKMLRGASEVIADQRAHYEQNIAALERQGQYEQQRNEFERTETARNQADRVAGDGPLAPVLRNGLHKLSLRQADIKARNTR